MAEDAANRYGRFTRAADTPQGAPDSPYAGFKPAEADAASKAIAVGQGVVGGALETGGAVAGAYAGAIAMAPVPIPGARVAGAVVGFGLGAYFGYQAKQVAADITVPGTSTPLTRGGIEDYDPELRPYAVGGEVVGGAYPFAAGTMVLARSSWRFGKSYVGSMVNRILDSAKNTPGAFLAAESTGATGAAVWGGGAEAAFPGKKGVRFGAEMTGGFFNPVRLGIISYKSVRGIWTKVSTMMSKSGQEDQASRIINAAIEEAGEDPILLAKLLEDAAPLAPGIGPQTAAQRTGSEALSILEAKLSEINGAFSKEAGEMTRANFTILATMIDALRGSSRPGAMQKIAALEKRKFRMLLDGLVAAGERDLAVAVRRITKDTPEARAIFSAQAKEVLGKSLTIARRAETTLWTQVDETVEVLGADGVSGADAVFDTIANIRSTILLPEEKLPAIISGFFKRLRAHKKYAAAALKPLKEGAKRKKPPPPITTGELIKIRSRSLALVMEAQAKGDYSDARTYGMVAESILDDLDGAFVGDEAYTAARSFSRELHDVFTRTFAGLALSKGAKGADRIPPELLLNRALATGGDAANMRLRELEEATKFMSSKHMLIGEEAPAAAEFAAVMTDAQERLLRLAAAETVRDGRPNVRSLQNFIDNNSVLMRRFPDARRDLIAAVDSEKKMADLLRNRKASTRVAEQRAAFSSVAKVENAATVIRGAVGGMNPERDLIKLAKLAKKDLTGEATEGLRASLFDYALAVGTTNGVVDFKKVRAALFSPVNPRQPSVAAIMEKAGIFDPNSMSVKSLVKILDEADKLTKVAGVSGREGAEEVAGVADSLFSMVLRGLGSTAATRAARKLGMRGSGPSLIIAKEGSKLAQTIVDKIPIGKVRDILIEAAKSPKFMAMLIRRVKPGAEEARWYKQIHSYMLQAGFFKAEDMITGEPVE